MKRVTFPDVPGTAGTTIDPDELAPSGWGRASEVLWHVPRLLAGLGPLGPRGPEDGPPVLVLPGFMANDRTTMDLRRALARAGWRAYPWEDGTNRGARPDTLDRLKARLAAIYDGRPVLLVGWSLGGMFARELARVAPGMVRAVVTLGSPFSGDPRNSTNIRAWYERIAGHPVDQPPIPRSPDKPPVPTLAFYSRRDGIVSVRSARGLAHETDRAVELDTGHIGFAIDRRALSQMTVEIRRFLEETEPKAGGAKTPA